MLIDFTIENYKSIKEARTFSFISGACSEHNDSIPMIDNNLGQMILPVSVLYGANGSGKTVLLNGLKDLAFLVSNSITIQEGDLLPYFSHKLDLEWTEKPTQIEVNFTVGENRYYYGISFNRIEILEEYLYTYPKNRMKKIFHRKKDIYEFSSDKSELENLSKKTLKNRLFLSVASNWNYEKVKPAFLFLKEDLIFSLVEDSYNQMNWMIYTSEKLKDNEKFKEWVLNVFNELDFGICDMTVEIENVRNAELDHLGMVGSLKTDGLKKLRLETIRNGKNTNKDSVPISMPFNTESDGTQKLFALLGPIYDMLNKGKIIIFDELDIKLHPLITRYIISIFQNKEFNKNQSQLLFTTHDTNLLDLNFMRRDQIWFAEKDDYGVSDYYSLYNLNNVRKTENIQKNYIRGKYGAIPFLKSGELSKSNSSSN